MKIIDACEEVLGKDVVNAMVDARIFMPTIAAQAALSLFLKNLELPEPAFMIRKYLNELEEFGSSTLH